VKIYRRGNAKRILSREYWNIFGQTNSRIFEAECANWFTLGARIAFAENHGEEKVFQLAVAFRQGTFNFQAHAVFARDANNAGR
jgi:hypothetical protein